WKARQRPRLAKAGDRTVDQVRPHSAERCVVDAELRCDTGAEVFDNDIALRGEARRDLASPVRLEIELEAALVAIDQFEAHADTFAESAHGPLVIARRRLDLDDLGSDIGHQGRAEGAGQDPTEVENPDAGQRLGHRNYPRLNSIQAAGYRSRSGSQVA